MSDSVQPHTRQPNRLLCPWDSPGKNAGVGCHFLLQCMKVKSESEVAQSCPTLSDPMDCRPPGSSIHGILQARVLEWVAIAYSRGSSWPKDWTHVSCIGRRVLYHCATWEAPHNWICKAQINYCLLKCSSYFLNLATMVLFDVVNDVHRHFCTPGIPTLRKVGDSWSTEMTNPSLTDSWL